MTILILHFHRHIVLKVDDSIQKAAYKIHEPTQFSESFMFKVKPFIFPRLETKWESRNAASGIIKHLLREDLKCCVVGAALEKFQLCIK